jgi:hypothetical protein
MSTRDFYLKEEKRKDGKAFHGQYVIANDILSRLDNLSGKNQKNSRSRT